MGYCIKCGKTMADKDFYMSNNLEKYPPSGRMNICKKCITMHVDSWDPETYLWILEEADVPYIKEEWDKVLAGYKDKPDKLTGTSVVGKYLARMKLKQHTGERWADSEKIAERKKADKIQQMQAAGMSEGEIDEQLAIDRTPEKPKAPKPQSPQVDPSVFVPEYQEEDDIGDQLTDEEKLEMKLKWGRSYRADEWIRMETLYREMMDSYDIQSAGHKDTLIMICKASLKVNQLLDAGDIDGAQKMSKVYNDLMKSGKFTAAQNKEESGEAVDSIGELVAICERDGFIPKFYIDTPNDKVDRVIQDMQEYTHDLVTEELGLGNLIQNAVVAIEREKEAIAAAAETGGTLEEQQEAQLFSEEGRTITDKDFAEFFDLMDDSEVGDDINES